MPCFDNNVSHLDAELSAVPALESGALVAQTQRVIAGGWCLGCLHYTETAWEGRDVW